jgi:hypothetical protein
VDESGITLELGGAVGGFGQPIADLWLRSDLPVAAGARPGPPPAGEPIPPGGTWRLVFRGPAIVEGSLQQVEAWRDDRGDRRIVFADGERFWVAADGGRAVRLPAAAKGLEGARLIERAVGAPLALALAARVVHLLHASALADRAGRVVAITAGAGAGKSTLAAAAAIHPDLGLTRIADDVLPVRLGPVPSALPHFPQLKLAPEEQYPAAGAARLALAALVEIEHSPSLAGVERERSSPAEALLGLVRASVGTRLFDARRAAEHFELCADASRGLPVVRMRFPSGRGGLRAALVALAEILGGGEPASTPPPGGRAGPFARGRASKSP